VAVRVVRASSSLVERIGRRFNIDYFADGPVKEPNLGSQVHSLPQQVVTVIFTYEYEYWPPFPFFIILLLSLTTVSLLNIHIYTYIYAADIC